MPVTSAPRPLLPRPALPGRAEVSFAHIHTHTHAGGPACCVSRGTSSRVAFHTMPGAHRHRGEPPRYLWSLHAAQAPTADRGGTDGDDILSVSGFNNPRPVLVSVRRPLLRHVRVRAAGIIGPYNRPGPIAWLPIQGASGHLGTGKTQSAGSGR